MVSELTLDSHRTFLDARGALCPLELVKILDFPVVRLFWVARVPAGLERGGHAHKQCSQYLVCISGPIEVTVSDGTGSVELQLEPGQGLLIRPGLWATERYSGDGAVLLVLCDRPYDKGDYIADFAEFLTYRRACEA